jgi:TolB-like protein
MMSTVVSPTEETTAVFNGVPAAEIRSQLALILRSRAFIQSHRIRRFLQFVVEESLLGQPHRLKEYLIGLEVFDRREAFDPRVDSIVRVEARRLRYKLDEYYRSEGREDGLRIVLRKGSYVPIFEYRSAGNGVNPASSRRSMEIALFSLINATSETGARAAAAEEIQRRLAHVLIKEGCFQVVVKPQSQPLGSEASDIAAAGTSRLHADYVVEGSMEFQEDGFRLLLQLQQSVDGSYIWSEITRRAGCRICPRSTIWHSNWFAIWPVPPGPVTPGMEGLPGGNRSARKVATRICRAGITGSWARRIAFGTASRSLPKRWKPIPTTPRPGPRWPKPCWSVLCLDCCRPAIPIRG